MNDFYFTWSWSDPTIYKAIWDYSLGKYICNNLHDDWQPDDVDKSSFSLDELYYEIKEELETEEKHVMSCITTNFANIIEEFGAKLYYLEQSYQYLKKEA